MNDYKVCTKCSATKPIAEFSLTRTTGKIHSWCKPCKRIADKAYGYKNKEKNKERCKQWREQNPEKARLSKKRAIDKNKEHYKTLNREKQRKYRETKHPVYLANRCRKRMKDALKGHKPRKTTMRYVGCSNEFLKEYLQSLFTDGMTWDNYGDWHIDHIIPLSYFDLTDEAQLEEACHYTNLQPLWAEDNLRKGARCGV